MEPKSGEDVQEGTGGEASSINQGVAPNKQIGSSEDAVNTIPGQDAVNWDHEWGREQEREVNQQWGECEDYRVHEEWGDGGADVQVHQHGGGIQ